MYTSRHNRASASNSRHDVSGRAAKTSGRSFKRIAVIYIIATAFCVLFSAVYEHFSFGVYSPFMVWMAAIPFALGVIPTLIMGTRRQYPRSRMAAGLWGTGIMALTIGSCMQGVLDIYGTTSDYMIVYPIVGIAILVIAAIIAKMHKSSPDPFDPLTGGKTYAK